MLRINDLLVGKRPGIAKALTQPAVLTNKKERNKNEHIAMAKT
jgi:hypothetical protein